MPLKTRNKQDGFTLIELLIVVAIIGILAAIAIPNLLSAMQRAKQKRTMADIRSIASAWEMYAIDNNGYTAAGTAEEITEDEPPSRPGEGDGLLAYDEVAAGLSPDYIKKLPEKDGWGNSYLFLTVQSGSSYLIGSLGKDGALDDGEWRRGEATTDFNCDIIYWNGSFIKYPEGAQQ